jgi:hypothetical protein
MWIEKLDARGKTYINLAKANMVWTATDDDDRQNYKAEPGDVVVWFEQYGAVTIKDTATKLAISVYLARDGTRLEAAHLDAAREISKTIMDIAEDTGRMREHLLRNVIPGPGDEPTSAYYSPPTCEMCEEPMEEAVIHTTQTQRELVKVWVCSSDPRHPTKERS